MPRVILTGLAVCLFAAFGGVAGRAGSSANSPPPGPPWASAYEQDHPLVGKLWRPTTARFETIDPLVAALHTARFVLLGEKHDNADHHRFQAWAVERAFDGGRRPAVAMEMINKSQEAALADHRAKNPSDASGVGAAVAWDETGWPAWSLYQPVVEPFLLAGLPVLPASLARPRLRQVVREGVNALGTERVAALNLDKPPDDATLEKMRAEIVAAHCGQLPATMIDPMVNATFVKDAVMAEALLDGAVREGDDGAFMVAGNGHVRLDRGIPWHLARLSPGADLISIGLIEVVDGLDKPAHYGSLFGVEALPFDFVWFTPRADDEDPCEKYAGSLKRAKDRHLDKKSGDDD